MEGGDGRTRINTEFTGERPPQPGEDGERIGQASLRGQGTHQIQMRRLVQRACLAETFGDRPGRRMIATGQRDGDASSIEGRAHLIGATPHIVGEIPVTEIVAGGTAPPVDSPIEIGRIVGFGQVDDDGEVGGDTREPVAGTAGLDMSAAEQRA